MSEDLIRRSDAINLCEKWRNRTNEHHDKDGWYIAVTLLNAIKELPSADRPQGEWIDMWDKYCFEGTFKCSVCGTPWTLIDGTPQDNGMNFCPNCGASMREREGE